MAKQPKNAECRKAFRFGFKLGEGELRRLHETMTTQIKKKAGDDVPHFEYEINYQNGAVARPASLDAILKEENSGPRRITALTIIASDTKEEESPNNIYLRFVDTMTEEINWQPPISLLVEGDERDWVFITTSELEERIEKLRSRATWIALRGMPMWALAWLSMLPLAFAIWKSNADSHQRLIAAEGQLKQLSELVHNNMNSNINDSIISATRILLAERASRVDDFFILCILIVPSAILLYSLSAKVAPYLFPPYNFLWGDYTEQFQKRQSVAQFIVYSVIGVIILGVVANYLSRRLGF